MNRLFCGLGNHKAIIAAFIVATAWPGALQAAWLGFRNDLSAPVVIQTVTVVNGVARERPRILLLGPGEVSIDPVIQPVHKLIVISDAKTKRVLFQETLAVTNDLFFSVQSSPPDRAKLVPTKMPTPPKRPMQ
jgi:hypothetical protein